MRGFQPGRGKPAQHFSDGGFVKRLKQVVGLDEERNAMVAKYRAEQAQERAAQAAAAQPPAPAPAEQPKRNALSDYVGMGAMQRREKAAGFASGGLIRGPGTGTSDSIPDEMRPGTFIMPADSTQALGLDDAPERDDEEGEGGERVPVRVSNGEFEIPPEQVAAVGAAALAALEQAQAGGPAQGAGMEAQVGQAVLTAIRDATHTPPGKMAEAPQFPPNEAQPFQSGGKVLGVKPAGFQPQAFASGGTVEDELVAQIPRSLPGGVRAPAYDGSQDGLAGSELGRNLNNAAMALPGVAGLARVPATGGAISKALNAVPQAAGFAAGAMGLGGVGAQAVQPVASSAGAGRGSVNPPLANPSAPTPTMPNPQAGAGTPPPVKEQAQQPTSAPTNTAPTGIRAAGFAPQAVQPQPAGVAAPRSSLNDWQMRNNLRNLEVSADSITNTRRWGGRNADRNPSVQAYQQALKTDAELQQGNDQAALTQMREQGATGRAAMQDANALQRTAMQEAGATQREQGRTDVAMGELDMKRTAAGFQTRAAARLEGLQDKLMAETDPEKRAALARQIREIQGKEKPDEWQAVALQGSTDAMGNKTQGVLAAVNKATGELRRMDSSGPTAGALGAAPPAGAIEMLRANPALASQFDAKYGPGAAQRALAQK